MEVTILGNRVLIQPITEEEKKSGIIIPDAAKEKPERGLVIAVGEGKHTANGERIIIPIQKGDKVMYGKYSGTEIELANTRLLVLDADDVMMIIHKED